MSNQGLFDDYPAWICNNCGLRYGRKAASDGATWHLGKCEICNSVDSVTEPRDFGHIADKWLDLVLSKLASAPMSETSCPEIPDNSIEVKDGV